MQKLRQQPPSVDQVGSRDEEYDYDAFISYSRKDQAFAQLLERRIEAYRPPKGLGLPARYLRVFLDTSDIRGPDYTQTIERELRRSKTLIVVCSPAARASAYVQDEIRRFIALRRAQGKEPQIVSLLMRGIPNNEAKTPDDEGRKAFPEALYEAATIPLAQSFLEFDPKRHKLDRGDYRDAWLGALADLFDVDRHELEGRDAKRQARTRGIVAIIALVALVVVSGLAGLAWLQRGEAISQRDQALRQELRAFAALGESETRAGNAVDGMLLALRGMPVTGVEEQRPVVTETRQGLLDATLSRREAQVLRGYERGVNAAGFAPAGDRIVGGGFDGTVRLWDAASGAELKVLRGHEGAVNAAGFAPAGDRIVSGGLDDTVRLWNAASGEELLVLRGHKGSVSAAGFAPTGDRIVSGGSDGTVRLWFVGKDDADLVAHACAALPRDLSPEAFNASTSIRTHPGPVPNARKHSGRTRSKRRWNRRLAPTRAPTS